MTETDHGKPYTDADVETAAEAAHRALDDADEGWHYDCMQPDAEGCPSGCFKGHPARRMLTEDVIPAVLDALTAAGWRKAGRPTPHLNTVKAERDEARRIADSLRQDLSDAGDVIAAVREAAERLDRALAGRLPSLPDVRAAVEHIDRALAAYDILDSTQPDWSHEIAFDTDGTWSIGHPDGCPGQAGGDCDVQRLAREQMAGPDLRASMAGQRFRCAVNDLRDRFLLGDGIDAEKPVSSVIAVSNRFARAANGLPPARRDWVRLRTGSGRQYEDWRDPSCPGDGIAGHQHDVRCVDRTEG